MLEGIITATTTTNNNHITTRNKNNLNEKVLITTTKKGKKVEIGENWNKLAIKERATKYEKKKEKNINDDKRKLS